MKPSPAPDQAVCSCCGERPATNYICYGGTGRSAALCEQCLATEDPSSAAFTKEARAAKCDYCGGSPCGGGPDTLSQITGAPAKNRWLCMSCSPEYHSFLQNAFATVSEALAHDEQIEQLKKISAEVDAHMAAFVRCRDN